MSKVENEKKCKTLHSNDHPPLDCLMLIIIHTPMRFDKIMLKWIYNSDIQYRYICKFDSIIWCIWPLYHEVYIQMAVKCRYDLRFYGSILHIFIYNGQLIETIQYWTIAESSYPFPGHCSRIMINFCQYSVDRRCRK